MKKYSDMSKEELAQKMFDYVLEVASGRKDTQISKQRA